MFQKQCPSKNRILNKKNSWIWFSFLLRISISGDSGTGSEFGCKQQWFSLKDCKNKKFCWQSFARFDSRLSILDVHKFVDGSRFPKIRFSGLRFRGYWLQYYHDMIGYHKIVLYEKSKYLYMNWHPEEVGCFWRLDKVDLLHFLYLFLRLVDKVDY